MFIVTSCAVFKEPAGVFQRETTSLLYSGTTKQEAAYVSVGVYYDGKAINITSTIWLNATDLIKRKNAFLITRHVRAFHMSSVTGLAGMNFVVCSYGKF